MNILVVGAAGFVGSHLVKHMRSAGHNVVGLDIDGVRQDKIFEKTIPTYCCDFGSQSMVQSILQRHHIDIVVQCGGHTPYVANGIHPSKLYTNDVICNLFFLDTLIKSGIKKFIFLSSQEVFGMQSVMPISSNACTMPVSALGNAQLFVENALESFRNSDNISYAIIRCAEITGLSEVEYPFFVDNLSKGRIAQIVRYICGKVSQIELNVLTDQTVDGSIERDYVHIDDFCTACMNILPMLVVNGESFVYNVGMGNKYSMKEVIMMAEETFGVSIDIPYSPIADDVAPRAYFDVFKTRNDLQWSPKYDTLEKIFDTYKHYLLGKQRV